VWPEEDSRFREVLKTMSRRRVSSAWGEKKQRKMHIYNIVLILTDREKYLC